MLGFGGYLVFGLICGCAYDKLATPHLLPLFVVFYGLMQSSGNLGPGDMLGPYTTNKILYNFIDQQNLGLLSSESYATAVRGTCYGISAALGKTGAAVGTAAFKPIQIHLGKRWTFIIAAICGIAGMLVTFLFVPNLQGDDLAIEDEKFRAFLVKHGWHGEMGEDDLKAEAEVGVPSEIMQMEFEAPHGNEKLGPVNVK